MQTYQDILTSKKPGSGFDPDLIRGSFPILKATVHGKKLVYLDNAATTQKPESVIKALDDYYRQLNSNVHRGVHSLSEKATEAYEGVRDKARQFINASSNKEIIFLRGTTEGINLVAGSYGRSNVGQGDEILITGLEHHSNIVPWQMLCNQTGAVLKVAPIDDKGEVILSEFERLIGPKTRIVAIAHVSNALGTVNPVKRMVAIAHAHGIPVLLDGAQAVPHFRIDVRNLDCDFYAFSAHKMYGPTGIGVLYGKQSILEAMPPYQGGGDMIRSVTFEKTIFNDLPHKFEAGTPNIADTIGLGAAFDFLNGLDWNAVSHYEHELLTYASEVIGAIPGVRIVGTAGDKAGVVSFVMEDVHPHDIGTILDWEGIAVRTGHHCAQPVMQRFGIPATVRASFALYNTKEEIDELVRGIYRVKEVFH